MQSLDIVVVLGNKIYNTKFHEPNITFYACVCSFLKNVTVLPQVMVGSPVTALRASAKEESLSGTLLVKNNF